MRGDFTRLTFRKEKHYSDRDLSHRSECIGCQLRISEIDTTESNIRVGMQLKSKG